MTSVSGLQGRNLLGPTADFLMIGGASGIFLILFIFVSPANQDVNGFAWAMFILHGLVNFPHFLVSYQFLYGDNRKKILTKWRFALAGLVVPFLLFGYIGYSLIHPEKAHLGYLANAMLFLVGWHYTRQILGLVIVTAELRDYPINALERKALSAQATGIWGISYLDSNIASRFQKFFGIDYKTFSLPEELSVFFYVVILVSFFILLLGVRRKFIEKSIWPPRNTVVAFSTFYLWHLPVLYHPSFAILIPFFHSLQYLLVAFAYVKNRFSALASSLSGTLARESVVKNITLYLGASIVMGRIFFNLLPEQLDVHIPYNREIYGTELFLFLFYVFINIHHYFIDFAIWRRDNDHVRSYIFASK